MFYFVFVMYSYTTGGPFGLEDQVTTSGPGLTLLYDLFIPLLWCIPISLIAAELTTAMPVEGGFYRWSRAAFGDFWGFLAGFWNWSASFLLGGAYAVLFTDYLGFVVPGISGWKHYLISVSLIALITYINVRGIQMVGRVATILTIIIFLPVIAMCIAAIPKFHHNPFSPLIPPHQPVFQVFGIGLAIGLWLYAGYEQLSSVAEEVENPQRNYPLALAIVVPLSIATYVLPTFLALGALGNWQDWHTRYFSDAAQLIGGHWLGLAMTLAGAIMMVSILNATVLTSTRMPFAMAEDGYMSEVLTRLHPRFGTPWIAIIFSAHDLRVAGVEVADSADLGLRLAAHCHIDPDRALGVEVAAHAPRYAAAFPGSLGKERISLRRARSNPDERRCTARQRSLCAALGAGCIAGWSDRLPVSAQKRVEVRRREEC